jgi:hypothetical protein
LDAHAGGGGGGQGEEGRKEEDQEQGEGEESGGEMADVFSCMWLGLWNGRIDVPNGRGGETGSSWHPHLGVIRAFNFSLHPSSPHHLLRYTVNTAHELFPEPKFQIWKFKILNECCSTKIKYGRT